MKNPTGKKINKLVFGMFDQMVEGADKYVTEQGSTWLIFTDEKRWIIEFTEDRTLWFNYNLFQSEFELIGKDCIEDIDLIKNWFESRFLNKPKVKHTNNRVNRDIRVVEYTIENGVKGTDFSLIDPIKSIEYTIKKGVRHTMSSIDDWHRPVEDTIQNGVKNIRHWTRNHLDSLEDTIKNGEKIELK
jgi:hypothetical protein